MTLRVAVLGSVLLFGCSGGDGRPDTAPRLPEATQDTPCSEFDAMADGTIDLVWSYTYDGDGFATKVTSSSGEVINYTYDDDHFLLHVADNYDDTPALEYEETYTRDPDGRVLTYEEKSGMETTSNVYTYDSKGRVVTGMITDADGTTAYSYTYTGDNLVPTSARVAYPSGSATDTYTTTDNEHAVHVEIDQNDDGTVDGTNDYKLDSERRQIESITRVGGMVVSRTNIAYAKRGLTSSYVFADHEGSPDDYARTSQFDSRGMWMSVDLESPSGKYMSSIYKETAKASCVTPRQGPFAAPVRGVRRHERDLPFLFGVQR